MIDSPSSLVGICIATFGDTINKIIFPGKWYGTMKTGIGDSILAYFTEIYDSRIVFKKNDKGGFDLRAG